jgi:hypothetical protein
MPINVLTAPDGTSVITPNGADDAPAEPRTYVKNQTKLLLVNQNSLTSILDLYPDTAEVTRKIFLARSEALSNRAFAHQ